jgi:hypothetical protein
MINNPTFFDGIVLPKTLQIKFSDFKYIIDTQKNKIKSVSFVGDTPTKDELIYIIKNGKKLPRKENKTGIPYKYGNLLFYISPKKLSLMKVVPLKLPSIKTLIINGVVSLPDAIYVVYEGGYYKISNKKGNVLIEKMKQIPKKVVYMKDKAEYKNIFLKISTKLKYIK